MIFLESSSLTTIVPAFKALWFGETPAHIQIGTYTGGGVGLGTGGDAINLHNNTGQLQASVSFGGSPTGPSFPTFDNVARIDNTTISQLSVEPGR